MDLGNDDTYHLCKGHWEMFDGTGEYQEKPKEDIKGMFEVCEDRK